MSDIIERLQQAGGADDSILEGRLYRDALAALRSAELKYDIFASAAKSTVTEQRATIERLQTELEITRQEKDERTNTIARLQSEIAAGHTYASRLAVWLQRHRFAHVSGFSALPDLQGVLSQIDNMIAGLSRYRDQARELERQAREDRDDLGEWIREVRAFLRQIAGEPK